MKSRTLLAVLCCSVLSAGASPEYKANEKMGVGEFKSTISYLAMGEGVVYALEDSGRVIAFDSTSCAPASRFDTGLNNTQAIAVNDQGEIFVFATRTEQKEITQGGRKYNRNVPVGVDCKVFDAKGKELRALKIDCLKSAKAAKFSGDTLVVADLGERKLVFIDPATGAKTASVDKGLRICCGIFDFCVGPNDTVAVANLGAFQVQQYNMDGKMIHSFGKRGKGFDEFQGCCNPVSACYLSDGSVLTVEKSPTRVKIYDAEGKNARSIEGIENLVQGCSYIPLAVDDEGNVFLAASRKGYLIKCVPKS